VLAACKANDLAKEIYRTASREFLGRIQVASDDELGIVTAQIRNPTNQQRLALPLPNNVNRYSSIDELVRDALCIASNQIPNSDDIQGCKALSHTRPNARRIHHWTA